MTLSFLQTARYNATPRLARLDDGQAKQAPQFKTQEEYAAALFPYLKDFLVAGTPSNTWTNARKCFELALEEHGLVN